ncbi:hypothetical protein [Micromonospora sp. NPDC023633]|uniref:hypothetical protein n=1 Tax=Micromonospora sp. NPDC023633 TaxID=3154320 RepID=UPI0033C99E1C
MVASLALAVAVALVADQEALTALAEGFGWGGPVSNPPATSVVAEGFGWGAPVPVHPGM